MSFAKTKEEFDRTVLKRGRSGIVCDEDALTLIRHYISGSGCLTYQMIADFYETNVVTVWRITSFHNPYQHLRRRLSETELRELKLAKGHFRGGTSVAKVRAIKRYYRRGMSIPDCAAAIGVTYQTAYCILKGVFHKDVE